MATYQRSELIILQVVTDVEAAAVIAPGDIISLQVVTDVETAAVITPNETLILQVITETEEAAAYEALGWFDKVLWWDASASSFLDYTAEAKEDTANDVPLVLAASDILYLGLSTIFTWVRFIISTNGSYIGGVFAFEYWNGVAWTAMPELEDFTGLFEGGTGDKPWVYEDPGDWAKTLVDTSTLYWLRFRCVSIGTVLTPPLGTRIYVTTSGAASIGRMGLPVIELLTGQVPHYYEVSTGNAPDAEPAASDLFTDGDKSTLLAVAVWDNRAYLKLDGGDTRELDPDIKFGGFVEWYSAATFAIWNKTPGSVARYQIMAFR